jgi:hypothetical protein
MTRMVHQKGRSKDRMVRKEDIYEGDIHLFRMENMA